MRVREVGGGDEAGKLSGDGRGESGGLRAEHGRVIGDASHAAINIGFLVSFKLPPTLVCVGIRSRPGLRGRSANAATETTPDLRPRAARGHDGQCGQSGHMGKRVKGTQLGVKGQRASW